MTDNNQKFTLMTEKDLSSVVGGKGEYGASGNRYVHCGAGIVGGASVSYTHLTLPTKLEV